MVGGKGSSLAARNKICSNEGRHTRDCNVVNSCASMCLFGYLQAGSKVRISGRIHKMMPLPGQGI